MKATLTRRGRRRADRGRGSDSTRRHVLVERHDGGGDGRRCHEEGVDAFVGQLETAADGTAGNQPLKPKMDGDVKVFTLSATQVRVGGLTGQFVDAMAFNGQIPGPQLEVATATGSGSWCRTR